MANGVMDDDGGEGEPVLTAGKEPIIPSTETIPFLKLH